MFLEDWASESFVHHSMCENCTGRGVEAQSKGLVLHPSLGPVHEVGSSIWKLPARVGDLLVT